MMVRSGEGGRLEDGNDVDCKCNDCLKSDSSIVCSLCWNVEAGFEGCRCRCD